MSAPLVEEEAYNDVFAGVRRRRIRTSLKGKANEPEQLQTYGGR
ncbi:hypothetical protein [Rhizobium leguminosarum]|nr:hypothetical protein [Rhizobium leguminosarum]